MTRKQILVLISLIMLSGCEEQNAYRDAILAQMTVEKDLKDYDIEPEKMTECVLQTSATDMPGIIPIDPFRRDEYRKYTKMLELNKSTDPNKTLEELRTAFGSPKKLAEAHANYTESVMECMMGLVTNVEQKLENKK